jgi:hypothetical protein
MTAFRRNQPVLIKHAAGRTETGRIVRPDRTLVSWYIVRFDVDGAKLCVSATSLQAAGGAK